MSRTIRDFNKSKKIHPNFKTAVTVMDGTDSNTVVANVKLIHDNKGKACIMVSESGLDFDHDKADIKVKKQIKRLAMFVRDSSKAKKEMNKVFRKIREGQFRAESRKALRLATLNTDHDGFSKIAKGCVL